MKSINNTIVKCEILDSFYLAGKGLAICIKNKIFDNLTRDEIYHSFDTNNLIEIHLPEDNKTIRCKILDINILFACFGEMKPKIALLTSITEEIRLINSIVHISVNMNPTRETMALNLLFHPERYPGMIRRQVTDIEFIIWKNITLGDYVSWCLFQSNTNEFFIRRVVWKQYTEYKLKKPETYASEYGIAQNTAFSILNELSDLQLTNTEVHRDRIVIDGIRCGIIYKKIQLDWYENPSELIQIIEWHRKTIKSFENIN